MLQPFKNSALSFGFEEPRQQRVALTCKRLSWSLRSRIFFAGRWRGLQFLRADQKGSAGGGRTLFSSFRSGCLRCRRHLLRRWRWCCCYWCFGGSFGVCRPSRICRGFPGSEETAAEVRRAQNRGLFWLEHVRFFSFKLIHLRSTAHTHTVET